MLYLATIVAFTFVASPLLAITIDGESRLTEEQFAQKHSQPVSEVKKTFAASGTLECFSGRRRNLLTAQLTGKNDIITTAGHAFVDVRTCSRTIRPEQCTFKVHDGKRAHTRAIQFVAMGNVRCELGREDDDSDWAVLKLSSPIPTIVPYDLGEVTPFIIDAEILSVSAQSQDFYLRGRPSQHIKTIDECSIKLTYFSQQRLSQFVTNCDAAPGNSGGALLAKSSSGQPRLLAIHFGNTAKSEGTESRNAPQDGRYQERTWSSRAIALTGEFRAALEQAIKHP